MEKENTKSIRTLKDAATLLLSRKFIGLVVSIIGGMVAWNCFQLDPWYILGLYGGFVGGNSFEHKTKGEINDK